MGASESSPPSKEAKVKVAPALAAAPASVRKIVEEEAYVARFKADTGEPIAYGLKDSKFPKRSIARGMVKLSIDVIGVEATAGSQLSGFMVIHTRSHMTERMEDVMNNVMGVGPIMYRLSNTDNTIRVAIFQRPLKYTVELEISVNGTARAVTMDCRKLTIDWLLGLLSKESGGKWQRAPDARELQLLTP
jgi:hypothetical protein